MIPDSGTEKPVSVMPRGSKIRVAKYLSSVIPGNDFHDAPDDIEPGAVLPSRARLPFQWQLGDPADHLVEPTVGKGEAECFFGISFTEQSRVRKKA